MTTRNCISLLFYVKCVASMGIVDKTVEETAERNTYLGANMPSTNISSAHNHSGNTEETGLLNKLKFNSIHSDNLVKVPCTANDWKPAYCFAEKIANAHVRESCQCRIVTHGDHIKYCHWMENVQMVLRKDESFGGDVLSYGYPCEVNYLPCKNEDTITVTAPKKYGSKNDTRIPMVCRPPALQVELLYSCPNDYEYDYLRISTCYLKECGDRYLLVDGSAPCKPTETQLPEWLGYVTVNLTKSNCNGHRSIVFRRDSKCRLAPLCDAHEKHSIGRNFFPPPLAYMPVAITSTLDLRTADGYSVDLPCEPFCEEELNVPSDGCQVLPSCDEYGEPPPAAVKRGLSECLRECVDELDTGCNRRPWCVYEKGTWKMPSQELNIYFSTNCTIRTCVQYEREYKDHCLRNLYLSGSHGTKLSELPKTLQSGIGLFTCAMTMFYIGIMLYPDRNEIPRVSLSSADRCDLSSHRSINEMSSLSGMGSMDTIPTSQQFSAKSSAPRTGGVNSAQSEVDQSTMGSATSYTSAEVGQSLPRNPAYV